MVDIADPDRLVGTDQLAWLRARSAAAAAELGIAGEVRVRLVDDRAMASAHERFAGIPGTTDVLTFDLREPGQTPGAMDADIHVCVDEARRQGESRGHSLEHELLLYILHGVLHCLGHDDHDEDAYRRMHDEEDRLLGAIGVGPVFAAPPRPERSA